MIAAVALAAIFATELAHLISSAHTGNQPDAAALVLNGVLRACKDMNVECSQARQ